MSLEPIQDYHYTPPYLKVLLFVLFGLGVFYTVWYFTPPIVHSYCSNGEVIERTYDNKANLISHTETGRPCH